MPLPKIPQATKDAWLPLLTSGTLKQARNKLCLLDGSTGKPAGYCCLAVLAVSQGANAYFEVDEGASSYDEDGELIDAHYESDVIMDVPDVGNVWDQDLLEQSYADTLGVTKEHQDLLSSLNDGQSMLVRVDNDGLLELCRKHMVEDGNAGLADIDGTERRRFHTRGGQPMSFEQIAAIIKEDL